MNDEKAALASGARRPPPPFAIPLVVFFVLPALFSLVVAPFLGSSAVRRVWWGALPHTIKLSLLSAHDATPSCRLSAQARCHTVTPPRERHYLAWDFQPGSAAHARAQDPAANIGRLTVAVGNFDAGPLVGPALVTFLAAAAARGGLPHFDVVDAGATTPDGVLQRIRDSAAWAAIIVTPNASAALSAAYATAADTGYDPTAALVFAFDEGRNPTMTTARVVAPLRGLLGSFGQAVAAAGVAAAAAAGANVTALALAKPAVVTSPVSWTERSLYPTSQIPVAVNALTVRAVGGRGGRARLAAAALTPPTRARGRATPPPCPHRDSSLPPPAPPSAQIGMIIVTVFSFVATNVIFGPILAATRGLSPLSTAAVRAACMLAFSASVGSAYAAIIAGFAGLPGWAWAQLWATATLQMAVCGLYLLGVGEALSPLVVPVFFLVMLVRAAAADALCLQHTARGR